MKLEVGRCYWTRNGQKSGPVRRGECDSYPFLAVVDGGTRGFTSSGRCFFSGRRNLDLTHPVEEEPNLPPVDEWQPWTGGECPVPDRAKVEALLQDGAILSYTAKEFEWSFRGVGGAIVAYVVRE